MAGSANKTIATELSVDDFLGGIADERRRHECGILYETFNRDLDLVPCIWGDSIIGYGSYHYRYASGREGDFLITGFAPRKAALSIYIMPGFDRYHDALARLGPHKHTDSCLNITRLDRVSIDVLMEIVTDAANRMKSSYDWTR